MKLLIYLSYLSLPTVIVQLVLFNSRMRVLFKWVLGFFNVGLLQVLFMPIIYACSYCLSIFSYIFTPNIPPLEG